MVYLLHFNKKLAHAQHYIGFVDGAEDRLKSRLRHHKKGRGSKLMKALTDNQIGFTIARLWKEGDRNFERGLKNKKKASEFCPICQQNKIEKNLQN